MLDKFIILSQVKNSTRELKHNSYLLSLNALEIYIYELCPVQDSSV